MRAKAVLHTSTVLILAAWSSCAGQANNRSVASSSAGEATKEFSQDSSDTENLESVIAVSCAPVSVTGSNLKLSDPSNSCRPRDNGEGVNGYLVQPSLVSIDRQSKDGEDRVRITLPPGSLEFEPSTKGARLVHFYSSLETDLNRALESTQDLSMSASYLASATVPDVTLTVDLTLDRTKALVVYVGTLKDRGHVDVKNGATRVSAGFAFKPDKTLRALAYSASVGISPTPTATPAALQASLTCPPNYVKIPANATVGANSDFCVMKYEAKILGNDDGVSGYAESRFADSRASGTPWANITRPQARSVCQALGAKYDLISNAQWQAIARNIETARNFSGAYLNWSNGSTDGDNAINRGHSDTIPNNALAASSDSDPCIGTGQVNCSTNIHPDFSQKRTHTLSNGEIIWDIAGNVGEWVKDDNGLSWPDSEISLMTAPVYDLIKWGPAGVYTGKNSGEYGGLGYGLMSSAVGGIFRGGHWHDGTRAGVFGARLQLYPSFSSGYWGFRCVYGN